MTTQRQTRILGLVGKPASKDFKVFSSEKKNSPENHKTCHRSRVATAHEGGMGEEEGVPPGALQFACSANQRETTMITGT